VVFRSKRLGTWWEAGSSAFDSANGSPEKASQILYKISQQKTSGRTQSLNDDLRRLSQADDLEVIFM
jgi:hypothetical protein